MTDSLTLAGIELLGAVPSTYPECAGALFILDPAFDLSGPQITSDVIAGLLLDGEQVTNLRASNRTPTLPVSIVVNSTGMPADDRLTLDAAREYLLRSAAAENWQLIWTRDGGLPLTFDCMGLSSVVINSAIEDQLSLVCQVTVTFQAFPYGHSDDEEAILIPVPSQTFDPPADPVTIDDFQTTVNFLQGDDTAFAASIGDWVALTNCAVTLGSGGSGDALVMTASASGTMVVASYDTTLGWDTPAAMAVAPGDSVHGEAWFRAATTGRSCNAGLNFYDTNGNLIGSTSRGSNITDTTSAYTKAQVTATAPDLAAWAILVPEVISAGAHEAHWISAPEMDRGAVYSAVESALWSASDVTAVSGQASALWTRQKSDAPTYDHVLSTSVDLTGLSKLTMWLGLATTPGAYKNWHKGTVRVAATLRDSSGNEVSFGAKGIKVQASTLIAKPHWQRISLAIPQNVPNFAYDQIASYSIQVWNTWAALFQQADLQASAYFCSVTATASSTGTALTRGIWAVLPGIVGSARAPVALQATPGAESFSTQTEFDTAGTQSWVAPEGVDSIDKVEAIGAGGAGSGGYTGVCAGGGGGGGGYTMKKNVAVTPGSTYHPVVGAGGSHGTGGASPNDATGGGDSYFTGDDGTTLGHGGIRGWKTFEVTGGGKGGQAEPDSDVSYPGGRGFQANVYDKTDPGRGGAGGSSAGSSSAGNDGNDYPPTPAPTGGGPGGQGGRQNITPQQGQKPASGPGGGGGGGSDDNSGGHNGGDGFDGMVRLTYGASGLLPMSSLLVHIPNPDTPSQFSPLCPVGNGSDTPNGSTEYTVPAIENLPARFGEGTYTLYLVADTYHSPGVSRTVTVTVKQYPYTGGTAITQALTRTLTPSTDVLNGYTDMGNITLPLADLPPGNTDAYFAVTVTSGDTADRFYDVLFLDTMGQLVFVNMGGSAWAESIWIDEAEIDRDLGRVLGSETDRDRARSILGSDPSNRISGGPLCVEPDVDNRVLIYQSIGVPGVTMSYLPMWWAGRLQ